MSIRDRISAVYPSFYDVKKRIADMIIENPEYVLNSTIQEICQKFDFSAGSLVEFSKSLGYSGFRELKIQIARETGPISQYIHTSINQNDSIQRVADKIFRSGMASLQTTEKDIDTQKLEQIASALFRAGRVFLYAFGTSKPVMYHAYYKFMRLEKTCFLLDDIYLQHLMATTMNEEDIVFLISHSGYTKPVVDLAECIGQTPAKTICMTGDEDSPLYKSADMGYIVSSLDGSSHFEPLSERLSQYTIIDVLFVMIALLSDEKAFERMKIIESSLTKTLIYEQED